MWLFSQFEQRMHQKTEMLILIPTTDADVMLVALNDD